MLIINVKVDIACFNKFPQWDKTSKDTNKLKIVVPYPSLKLFYELSTYGYISVRWTA